jgi:DeoR/GlpR family transcriptional regulator of sugar metabolism
VSCIHLFVFSKIVKEYALRPGARHQRILEIVSQGGHVDVETLSEEFAVSPATVRRDLAALGERGALLRVYRGARRMTSASYEPPFPARAVINASAKAKIAETVNAMLEDRQTVILDAGTTGVAIAERLVERDLTICTPSLRVANALLPSSSIRLMVTGGIVRPHEQSLVGPSAISIFESYHFDVYVMTVSALDAVNGLTEWNIEDAAIKRAALASAGRIIVACDSSKFGQTAFARICGIDAVDDIVTDDSLEVSTKTTFDALSADLVVAS